MWSVQSIAQGAVPDVHHMRCPSEVSLFFNSVEEICISCNFRLESIFPFCQQAGVNVPVLSAGWSQCSRSVSRLESMFPFCQQARVNVPVLSAGWNQCSCSVSRLESMFPVCQPEPSNVLFHLLISPQAGSCIQVSI